MFPVDHPSFAETVTPATTTFAASAPSVETVPVADLTLGVFDLSDTGLTADPAVMVWCAAVAERGVVW